MNDSNSSPQPQFPSIIAAPEAPTVTTTPVPDFTSPTQKKPTKSTKLVRPQFLVLGLLTILVAAGSFWWISTQSQPKTVTPAAQPVEVQPTPVPLFISLDATSQELLKGVDNEVLVSGSTTPQTAVVLFSSMDETTTTSDDLGAFAETLLIEPEGDEITVVVFSESGDEVQETIAVSPDSIDSTVLGKSDTDPSGKSLPAAALKSQANSQELETVAQGATEATTSTQTVSHGQLKKSNPNTSLTSPTPEIAKIRAFVQQTEKGELRATKSGVLKLRQLASSDPSLSSTRSAALQQQTQVTVYAVTPISPLSAVNSNRRAVSGIISSVSPSEIVLVHPTQRDRTFVVYLNPDTTINASGSLIQASILQPGMRIVAVGERIESGVLAKRIQVIPGKATGVFRQQPLVQPTGVVLSPTPFITGIVSGTPVPSESPLPTQTPTLTPTPTETTLPNTPTPTDTAL